MRGKLKLVVALAAAAVVALCVVGCSSGGGEQATSGLPSWANEAELTERGLEVADALVARDYDKLYELVKMEGTSAEDLAKTIDPALDKCGAFKSYGDVSFLQGERDGREFVTVVQTIEFENVSDPMRVSYYEDGTCCGFYI